MAFVARFVLGCKNDLPTFGCRGTSRGLRRQSRRHWDPDRNHDHLSVRSLTEFQFLGITFEFFDSLNSCLLASALLGSLLFGLRGGRMMSPSSSSSPKSKFLYREDRFAS